MEEILSKYTMAFLIGYGTIICVTWLVMVLAVLVDLWTGLDKAKARQEVIHSHLLRYTFVKISDYWRVQVFGIFVDIFGSLWYDVPIASTLIVLGILVIEGRSVIENLHAKKSAAATIPDIIVKIINAKNRGEANSIIEELYRQEKQKESNDTKS